MSSVATWAGAPGREIRTALGSAPEVWMPHFFGASMRLEPTQEDGILRELLCSWRMHFGRIPRGSVVTWRGAERFVEAVGAVKKPVGLVPSDAPTHAVLTSGHVAMVRGVLWWVSSGPSDLVPLDELDAGAQGELW